MKLTKTIVFGPSMTAIIDLKDYARFSWFACDRVRCLGGEVVAKLKASEAMDFH